MGAALLAAFLSELRLSCIADHTGHCSSGNVVRLILIRACCKSPQIIRDEYSLCILIVTPFHAPPQWGGLDLGSNNSGCARLGGSKVPPPLGVIKGKLSSWLSSSVGIAAHTFGPRHSYAVRPMVRRTKRWNQKEGDRGRYSPSPFRALTSEGKL